MNNDAQPTLDQAYEVAGNPTDKKPIEERRAHANANADDAIAQRDPRTEPRLDDATPTSMAQGVRGAPPGEEATGMTQEELDTQELTADQMGAPGEDKVADAVKGKHRGGGGSQPGLETDLDRKKAEQSGAREAMKEQKQENFDVGGVLGQRGGPSNPVDKNNYPNSGD